MSFLSYPSKLMILLAEKNYIPMKDDFFLKLKFKEKVGNTLNLNHPNTFNEKLQWLKLHDRKSCYTNLVDKYEVKKKISDMIGEEYIIPTLGVWEAFDSIDFKTLPNQFVLKCTHDSGGLVICKDKGLLNIEEAREKINKSLKKNYYYAGREWPYKNVKPRIIAEKYMTDESEVELKDYKIFNFEGEPKYIQVDFGRFTSHKRNLYTTNWDLIDVKYVYDTDMDKKIIRPKNLDKMLELARLLSKGHHFLRTDFYSIDDRIYFGELTFYPEAGFGKFYPTNFDMELGDLIEL